MGKIKDEEDSPSKKHKKHKKHRHRKDAATAISSGSFSLLSNAPEGDVAVTSPQPSIKLKIKIGGQTISTQSYTMSSEKEDSNAEGIPAPSYGEDMQVDRNESQSASKKDDDTSDEERQWLDALEAGELDDNGELKKRKDASMLTTRQKALLHGERIEELQELATVSCRPAILTEEQINRRQMRAKRRREQAQEKTEKDKQETLERLLKKQESKVKTTNKVSAKDKNANVPVYKYINGTSAISLSVPVGYEFPLSRQLAPEAKPVVICGVDNCRNRKRYSCSKTGIPLCSLDCYRRNLELIEKQSTSSFLTVANASIPATS